MKGEDAALLARLGETTNSGSTRCLPNCFDKTAAARLPLQLLKA